MSELMDYSVINMPYEMAMSTELSRRQYYNRARSLLKELKELRAYKKRVQKECEDAEKYCSEKCHYGFSEELYSAIMSDEVSSLNIGDFKLTFCNSGELKHSEALVTCGENKLLVTNLGAGDEVDA